MQPSILWALTACCLNASLVFTFHREQTIPGIHLTRIYPHIHALSDNTLFEILLSKTTLTLGWWLNQMAVMQSQGGVTSILPGTPLSQCAASTHRDLTTFPS